MRRAVVAIAVLLPACTPQLDQAEIAEMLLKPERGVVGGIEIGDSWDEVKAHHDPRYTLDEDPQGSRRVLRRDLSRERGENGFSLDFEVDAQNKVQRYVVEIDGTKRNILTLRALRDAFVARFDAKLGAGRCFEEDVGKAPAGGLSEARYCGWPRANGKPSLHLGYVEWSDSARLSAFVNPTRAQAQPFIRSNDDPKEGCPCGCDHSEAMAGDLRAEPRDAALADIARTLRIIATREDAGFITEAMVRHRLRLLDLRTELQPHDDAPSAGLLGTIGPCGDRGVPLPPERRLGPRARVLEDATVRVRMDLVTHGRTTEIVEGREKTLPASFRLGMEIENLTDAELALAAPAIESSPPLPVSRWYVLGGDGRPWDGILRAREKLAVNAIGYLGRPVEPGAEIEATLRFHGLLGHVSARARRHWDRPD